MSVRRGLRGGFLPAMLGGLILLGACAPQDEIPTFEARRQEFLHSVSAEGVLVARQNTPIEAPRELAEGVNLGWRAADGIPVETGDLLARLDASNLELRLQQGLADLETNALTLEKTRSVAGTDWKAIEVDRRVAELELAQSRQTLKSDEELFSRNEIIESEIDADLADHKRDHAVARQQIHRAVSDAEMQLLEIERRQQQLAVEQARQSLSALEVRAPAPGILTWSRNWRGEVLEIGAQVYPGQRIAEIAGLAELEAEVYVLEADAGGLAVGQPAQIELEARPGEVLAGTIRRVDSVAKPRFRGSPVQYFGVSVAFDGEAAGALKPGQRLRARLLLERLPEALVIPRQAIFQGPGGSRVYVRTGAGLGGWGFEAREIRLEASSLGLVAVAEGLSPGEVVALEEPAGADPASAGG